MCAYVDFGKVDMTKHPTSPVTCGIFIMIKITLVIILLNKESLHSITFVCCVYVHACII